MKIDVMKQYYLSKKYGGQVKITLLPKPKKHDQIMYLPPGFDTKELESDVKNKWRWEWLHERDSWREMGRLV